jgi:hypothetical protein
VKSLSMTILYLVPVKKVKDRIPEPLKVTEVVPGYTLGGIYAARYGRGKDVVSEFLLMPAYVQFGDKKGYFTDHFCMDNKPASESCSSGQFKWGESDRLITLDVASSGSGLVSIRMRPLVSNIPYTGTLPFLCLKGTNVVYLQNHLISRIGISLSDVDMPAGSPLKDFPFGPKLITVFWDTSNVIYKEPELAGQRVIQRENALGTPMSKCLK